MRIRGYRYRQPYRTPMVRRLPKKQIESYMQRRSMSHPLERVHAMSVPSRVLFL